MKQIKIASVQIGFTLIELLVVIAIIGLLASITIVAVSRARAKARDTRRITDIKQIQKALEIYLIKNGSLPYPYNYGRGNISPGFWDTWWDLSTNPADAGFMNFLVSDGLMSKVPTDPLNTPSGFNGDPQINGYFYTYYIVPSDYLYQGGSCMYNKSDTYMLAIKDLETEPRPPSANVDSRCDCLWNNLPNMFQTYFDYVTCGGT